MAASFDPSAQETQQKEVLLGAGNHEDAEEEDALYGNGNLRVVGDLITRRVQFLKYHRQATMDYPPDAIVLNPKHTMLEQKRRQKLDEANGHTNENEPSSPNSLTAHAPVFARKRHAEDCEDDPRFKELPEVVCTEAQMLKILKLSWGSVGAGCGAGLVNCGNTCFANAVLQCLAFTPPIAQFFMQYVSSNSGLGGNTGFAGNTTASAGYDYAFALAEVIRGIHASKGKAIRPSPIIANLSGINKTFKIGKQSDAHEFFQCLVSKCHQSLLNKYTKGRKVIPLVANTGHLMRVLGGYFRSQVSWSKNEEVTRLKQANNAAAANDLAMNKTVGKGDKMVSNTYEIFTVINLQLVHEAGHLASRGGGSGSGGLLTVQQCLDDFFAKEQLDGRIYMTPRKVQVKAWKQFTLHIPPPTLTLHMKRFSNTGAKIGKPVQFPFVLDMRKYCSPNSDVGEAVYDLCAVAVHEGRSVDCGHYYAFVRGRNKLWYCCDDSSVRQVSDGEVQRCQAYMLFYVMQDNTLRNRIERITPPTTPTGLASNGSSSSVNFPDVSPRIAPKTVRAEPAAPATDEGKELSEEDLEKMLQENLRKSRALKLASSKEVAQRIELETESDDEDGDAAEEDGSDDDVGAVKGAEEDDEEAETASHLKALLERRASRSASESARSPGAPPAKTLAPPSPLSRPISAAKSPSASPATLRPSAPSATAASAIPSIFLNGYAKKQNTAPAAAVPAKLSKSERREMARKLFEAQMEIELPTEEEKAGKGVRSAATSNGHATEEKPHQEASPPKTSASPSREVTAEPPVSRPAQQTNNSALPKMSSRYAGIIRTVKKFNSAEEEGTAQAARLSGHKMSRGRGEDDDEEGEQARPAAKPARVMPFNKDALRRAQHTGSMEPTADGVAHRTLLRPRSEGAFHERARD